jgi:CspA family cold shock protein
MDGRDYGRIIHWSNDRGYGFIRPDAGECDVFVHLSECELPEGEEARIGDRVSYEIGADRRPGREARICAVRVRFVSDKEKPHREGGAVGGLLCAISSDAPMHLPALGAVLLIAAQPASEEH